MKTARPGHSWFRLLRRWIILLGIVYLVVVGVLLLLEDRLVYMATPATSSWYSPDDLTVEDIELTSADGTGLHAWWIPQEGAKEAILFCHGQRGNISHRTALIKRLLVLKRSILIFDYPGFGKSEGQPTEAGCYAAADAAYDWLVEKQGLPPDKIVIMGKSLGAGIATDIASRRPCRALVLVMAFTSLPEVAERLLPIVPARMLMRTRFHNLTKIRNCSAPVFLAHGTADWKIPPSHSERLYDAVSTPKRYFPMPGLNHGWPCLTEECLEELACFLDQCSQLTP